MRITFTVEIEVERVSGKFAPKDEIADALEAALLDAATDADVSGLDADGTSEYEVADATITRT